MTVVTKYLFIDLGGRLNPDSTTPSDCIIRLDQMYHNVISSMVISSILPVSWNLIDKDSNYLYFSVWVGVTRYSVELILSTQGIWGNYTPSAFLALLGPAMTAAVIAHVSGVFAAWTGNIATTYDPVTGQVTFTLTGGATPTVTSFRLDFGIPAQEKAAKLVKILGFPLEDTVASLVNLISPYDYDGSGGIHEIYVKCPQLCNNSQLGSNLYYPMQDCILIDPISFGTEQGTITEHTPNPRTQMEFTFEPPGRQFQDLQFKIICDPGTNSRWGGAFYPDFQGINPSFRIRLQLYEW